MAHVRYTPKYQTLYIIAHLRYIYLIAMKGLIHMGEAVLNIRMDEDIKRRFDAFCADAGMNATVAVNMFARAVLREKSIPFKIVGNDEARLDIAKTQKNKRSEAEAEKWLNSLVGVIPPLSKDYKELIQEWRLEDYENTT